MRKRRTTVPPISAQMWSACNRPLIKISPSRLFRSTSDLAKKYFYNLLACPLIFEKPKDTTAIFGQEATFFCDGVANLHPRFEWHKGNYKLQGGDKYKLTDKNRKLTIKNVNEDDLGKYKCTLSGVYGDTSAEASLASATGQYRLCSFYSSVLFMYVQVF